MADETKRMNEQTPSLSGVETKRLTEQGDASASLLPVLGLSPDTLLAGRYSVIKELGHGGEADVFLCGDTKVSNAKVAVKIYRGNFEPDENVLAPLKEISHPDILKLIDYGEFNGRFYEVSEYAEGGTLEGLKFKQGELVQTVIPEVLNAFKHIHEQGIIHRDIKPTNLFLRKADRTDIVVGDFGLSSVLVKGASLRMSQRMGISFSFSAPELFTTSGSEKQIFGREVDYYALGMTLISLLTGRDPFENALPEQIFFRKLQGEISIPDFCSPRVVTLIKGLTHPNRKNRWGAEEMGRWLDGEDVALAEYHTGGAGFQYKLSEDLKASSFQELAKLLLDYPDIAMEHIHEGTLQRTIETYDQPLGVNLRKIISRASSDKNALLGIVYTLDPMLAYRLLPGQEAPSPEALAHLIDKNEENLSAGKEQLFNETMLVWLQATGKKSIAEGWSRAAQGYPAEQQDAGLEHFLHLLDPALPLPSIKIEPARIEINSLESKSIKRIPVVVSNPGRGFLSGVAEMKQPMQGVSVSPNFFSGTQSTLTIELDAGALPRGTKVACDLILTSNAGEEVKLPVSFYIAFPLSNIVLDVLFYGILSAASALIFRVLFSLGLPHGFNWFTDYFTIIPPVENILQNASEHKGFFLLTGAMFLCAGILVRQFLRRNS